jgi:hypothetical protein
MVLHLVYFLTLRFKEDTKRHKKTLVQKINKVFVFLFKSCEFVP